MAERVQKVLARAGVASRRKAEVLIRQGQVTVNGEVAQLGSKVVPGDEVRVRGRHVALPDAAVTYLLHKPFGVVTTAADERGRPTVMELVPAHPGLHPVGRLDRDSEGLLLLTSDGNLTFELTHPSHGHEKEYRLWCREGTLDQERCRRLVAGVALDDGPARAIVAQPEAGGCRVIVQQGRNRLVRRMLAAVGATVERLVRTQVAGFRLGDLPVGSFRRVGRAEVVQLGYDSPREVEENLMARPALDRER